MQNLCSGVLIAFGCIWCLSCTVQVQVMYSTIPSGSGRHGPHTRTHTYTHTRARAHTHTHSRTHPVFQAKSVHITLYNIYTRTHTCTHTGYIWFLLSNALSCGVMCVGTCDTYMYSLVLSAVHAAALPPEQAVPSALKERLVTSLTTIPGCISTFEHRFGPSWARSASWQAFLSQQTRWGGREGIIAFVHLCHPPCRDIFLISVSSWFPQYTCPCCGRQYENLQYQTSGVLSASQCCPAPLVLLLIGYAVDCPTYKDLVAKNLNSPECKKISAQSTRSVCGFMYGDGVQWLLTLHPCSLSLLICSAFLSLLSCTYLFSLPSPSVPLTPPLSLSSFPLLPYSLPSPLISPPHSLSSPLPLSSSPHPAPSIPSFSPYLSLQDFSVQQKNWTEEGKANMSNVWTIADVGLCAVCPLPTCHRPH